MFDDPTNFSDVRSCSARLGVVAVRVPRPSDATTSALMGGAKEIRDAFVQGPLLYPHEIERVLSREAMRPLVLAQGSLPQIVERAQYDTDAAFAGRWDA